MFAGSGVSDWKNLGAYLKSHEKTSDHIDSVIKWLELDKGLKSGIIIEYKLQTQLQAERKQWRDILEMILAIIKYLATYNLAFRGHRESLDEENSGNFIGLVKLLAKFDPVIRDHLQRIEENPPYSLSEKKHSE